MYVHTHIGDDASGDDTGDDVTYVCDDVTYVCDDVTYVCDDVTHIGDDACGDDKGIGVMM